MSPHDVPILVMTSAKKKSLNLTLPKGEINISLRVIRSYHLAILYPHLKQNYMQYIVKKINIATTG